MELIRTKNPVSLNPMTGLTKQTYLQKVRVEEKTEDGQEIVTYYIQLFYEIIIQGVHYLVPHVQIPCPYKQATFEMVTSGLTPSQIRDFMPELMIQQMAYVNSLPAETRIEKGIGFWGLDTSEFEVVESFSQNNGAKIRAARTLPNA